MVRSKRVLISLEPGQSEDNLVQIGTERKANEAREGCAKSYPGLREHNYGRHLGPASHFDTPCTSFTYDLLRVPGFARTTIQAVLNVLP